LKPAFFIDTYLASLYTSLAGPGMKLSLEQEKERLSQWMREGAIYDPRNEEDYDTFEYGTEPLPNDSTWANKKAPDGADG